MSGISGRQRGRSGRAAMRTVKAMKVQHAWLSLTPHYASSPGGGPGSCPGTGRTAGRSGRRRSRCRPMRQPPRTVSRNCAELLEVGLAEGPRVAGDLAAVLHVLDARHVVEGERHLGRVEDLEDDDLVLLVPEVLERADQLVGVVEQVGQDDDQRPPLDRLGQLGGRCRSASSRRRACVCSSFSMSTRRWPGPCRGGIWSRTPVSKVIRPAASCWNAIR